MSSRRSRRLTRSTKDFFLKMIRHQALLLDVRMLICVSTAQENVHGVPPTTGYPPGDREKKGLFISLFSSLFE